MSSNKGHVLVSGGSGGIGSALCRLLPDSGYRPVVGYHSNAAQAVALAGECGGVAVRIDLTDDASISQALGELPPDICGVVLAASPPPELVTFTRLQPAGLLHQLQVNVLGPQRLLAGLIRDHFRKRKSGIVVGVLSETTGRPPDPPSVGMPSYVIAKSALRSMLDVCAAEYPWLKVRTVSPGFTRTKMLDVFDERYLALVSATTPIAAPADVARTILSEIVR